MAVGDKYPVLMASQLGTPNGPAALNAEALLPILQGGTLAGNPQLALANLGAGVRPNLWDNTYFVGGGSQQGGEQLPINQKGQTSYSEGGRKTTIDRWASTTTTITASLSQTGLALTSAGTSGEFYEYKFTDFSRFSGKYLTLSALTTDGQLLTTFGQVPEEAPSATTAFLDVATPIGIFRFSWSVPFQSYYISFAFNKTGSIDLDSVKVEEGKGQTLAYQDSTGAWKRLPQPDMDYGTQLARCKLYSQMIKNFSSGASICAWGFVSSENTLLFSVPTNQLRNATPAITLVAHWSQGGSYGEIPSDSTIGAIRDNGNSVQFTVTFPSPHGLTVGSMVGLRLQTDTNDYIYINANL